jgi:CRISPR-associated protein Cas5h
MKTLVFDVHGPYAMFRKQFTPVSPVSYPFPPPPTAMGIIGAICGYEKEEYLDKIGWETTKIGISISKSVKRYRCGINLVNTKGNKYFRLVGENPRSQIPHEFLKDVRYRIFVANAKERAMADLEKHLKEGTNTYTVSLGIAQCLAEVEYINTFQAKPLDKGEYKISSVIPMDQTDKISYEPNIRYGIFRIPERMRQDRVVTKYGEVVVNEESIAIKAHTSQAYQIGEDIVLLF